MSSATPKSSFSYYLFCFHLGFHFDFAVYAYKPIMQKQELCNRSFFSNALSIASLFYCFTSLVIGLDNPLHQVLPFFGCVWYLYRLGFLFSLQGRQVGEEEEKGVGRDEKSRTSCSRWWDKRTFAQFLGGDRSV